MIGVIVTLDEGRDGEDQVAAPSVSSGPGPVSKLVQWDVLGANLLDRFLRSLEAISPTEVAFLGESGRAPRHNHPLARGVQGSRSGCFSSWEEAAYSFLSLGAKALLLVKLNHYIDLDLTDLLRFHHATSSKLTQVFLEGQPVSVVLVQAAELRNNGTSLRKQLANTMPQRRRYQFDGYFNPLNGLDDFYQLCADSLLRRCGIEPVGTEVAPGVYAGQDASIHPTVVIKGPAYIGARSILDVGCTISGPLSVERDCEVDCGTSLESCLLTHDTYVGPGLNLKNAIAGPGWLYNAQHRTVVAVHDPKLLGSTHSYNLLTRAKSLLSSPWQWGQGPGSTFFSHIASLYTPARRNMVKNPSPASHLKFDQLQNVSNEENTSR